MQTKVFAGGAHIATMSSELGDAMKYNTADPVTGTTGIFQGSSSYGGKDEETEPMGQTIELTEPPAPPSSYTEVLGNAKDPEWQCEMTTGTGNAFRLMPQMCQEIISSGKTNQFSRTRSEKSPTRTSGSKGAPPTLKPGQKLSPDELARKRAIAATGKFDNEAEEDASSIPVPPDPFKKFRSDEKLSDADCDKHMSEIFGGVARAMENGLDINGANRNNGYPGHSATPVNDKPLYTWVDLNENGKKDKGEILKDVDRGGIIHTYTDETASARTDTPLFTPGGWTGAGSYYTGGNSGLVFNYSNGITIEFVHAGTFNKNLTPSIPKNPGMGNLAEIGYVGGAGGEGAPVPIFENGKLTGNSTAGYNHTHIVFFSNKAKNTRIDPRTIFCGW